MNNISIRKIYLYLFALIGLVISTIGAVQLVDLGLKTFVFPQADINYAYPMAKPISTMGPTSTAQEPSQAEMDKFNAQQRTSQRQRDAASALAMLIVGVPLYAYHWRVIKREQGTNA
jgi:disulfide bond formation protein DsbB